MKNDLTPQHLSQEVTLVLPLSAVLRLAELEHPHPIAASRILDLASLNALPAIGAEMNGGKFAGITLENGRPVLLVKLDGEFNGTHEDAGTWAKAQGGYLPSRHDGLVLLENMKVDFKAEYYWLEPQLAGDPGYAWYQGFAYGLQYWLRRSNRFHAVAVRRYPLQ